MIEVKTYLDIDAEQTARFAKALAHPARIMILKLLAGRSACYCGNIVEELPLAQSTVSQHLKELKNSGLIQGEITLPKIKYCINQENWEKTKVLFQELFEMEVTEFC